MIPPLIKNPRYHSLDLWRGLICIWVVLEHSAVALWPGAEEGVGLEGAIRYGFISLLKLHVGTPLFFVISGYCIAGSIDSLRRKGGSPWRFLLRRFWRIFPPYWAALLLFFGVVVGLDALGLQRLHRSLYALELGSPAELDRLQWLGNFTLTETWRPRFIGREMQMITRVAWSLCYQEQFYLICFLALVLAPRRLYGALGVATAAIVGFRAAAWDAGSLWRLDGLFPMLWHEFAIGLAIYWRMNVAQGRRERLAVDLGLALLLVLGVRFGIHSTVASAGFGLLLVGLRRFDDRLQALARMEPLRELGRRSFSIYLVHLPVCVVGSSLLAELGLTAYAARAFVMVPITTVAAIAFGCLFHRFIDARFHDLPDVAPLRLGLARLVAVLNRPIRLRPALIAVNSTAGGPLDPRRLVG